MAEASISGAPSGAIPSILDSFDARYKVVRINAYGELSLVPGIWDFLEALAARRGVRSYSGDESDFQTGAALGARSPSSISFILTSLHPETELDFEGFTSRCKALRDRGYEVLDSLHG